MNKEELIENGKSWGAVFATVGLFLGLMTYTEVEKQSEHKSKLDTLATCPLLAKKDMQKQNEAAPRWQVRMCGDKPVTLAFTVAGTKVAVHEPDLTKPGSSSTQEMPVTPQQKIALNY